MRLSREIISVICIILCASWAYSLTPHPGIPPCVPKPFPVVFDYDKFPEELRPAMKEFVDHLNYQVIDEIYLRFCNVLQEEVFLDCNIDLDTINRCTDDTLFLDFHAITIRDQEDGLANPAGIVLYEVAGNDSNYIGLRVSKGDTNNIVNDFYLVLPGKDGGLDDGGTTGIGSGPGALANYPMANRLSNSELVTDGRGHLLWQDRDAFTRVITDTITADSATGSSDILLLDAATFRFQNRNDLSAANEGSVQFRVYEDQDNGNSYTGFVWPTSLTGTWYWVPPSEDQAFAAGSNTTGAPTDPNAQVWGFMSSNGNAGTSVDIQWMENDRQYIQWGQVFSDTSDGGGAAEDTVILDRKYQSNSKYHVTLMWGPRHPTAGSDEYDSLWVKTAGGGRDDADITYLSDSSFIIITPAADSADVIWRAVGYPKDWTGVG